MNVVIKTENIGHSSFLHLPWILAPVDSSVIEPQAFGLSTIEIVMHENELAFCLKYLIFCFVSKAIYLRDSV